MLPCMRFLAIFDVVVLLVLCVLYAVCWCLFQTTLVSWGRTCQNVGRVLIGLVVFVARYARMFGYSYCIVA